MTPLDTLRGMRALLTPPAAWIKGAMAATGPNTDRQAREVVPTDPNAVCFCLLGARRRIVPLHEPRAAIGAKTQLAASILELHPERVAHHGTAQPTPHQTIAWFNDDPLTTHADILEVLDHAITQESTPSA